MTGRRVLSSSLDRPRRDIDPRKSGAWFLAVVILGALIGVLP